VRWAQVDPKKAPKPLDEYWASLDKKSKSRPSGWKAELEYAAAQRSDHPPSSALCRRASIAVADRACVRVLRGHEGTPLCMTRMNGDVVATGGSDNAIKVRPASALCELPANGCSRTRQVWRLSTGKLLRTLTGHSDIVRSLAYLNYDTVVR
jgi:WD40 repeat protein